jgi:hypothetical protein
MPFNPRGRIVCPSRPVSIGAATATGRLPGIIVRIRAGSGRLTKEFHRFCAYRGLHARPVQESVDGRPDFFEVVGANVDGLERLIGHPAVEDFHYILSTRVPVGSQGAGEVSDRVRRVINRQRLPKAERLAWEENDRRGKLTKDAWQDIELAEARARAAAL